VVALRNAKLDAHTTKFGANVLAEAGGDRKSPFFRRFFTVAPSTFVRQPLRKQCEATLHVMVAELGKLDKKHALKPFAASLTSLATDAISALEARTKAKAERATVSNDRRKRRPGAVRRQQGSPGQRTQAERTQAEAPGLGGAPGRPSADGAGTDPVRG
jgi:hypothetical protein